MNDLAMIIAFAALAAGIIGSRVVGERAFRRLDDAAKIRVMNEFSGMRIWSVIPVIALVVLLTAGLDRFAGHAPLILGGYGAGLIAYFALMHVLIRKKMVRAGAPGDYISKFMVSRWISYLSLFAVIAVWVGPAILRAWRRP